MKRHDEHWELNTVHKMNRRVNWIFVSSLLRSYSCPRLRELQLVQPILLHVSWQLRNIVYKMWSFQRNLYLLLCIFINIKVWSKISFVECKEEEKITRSHKRKRQEGNGNEKKGKLNKKGKGKNKERKTEREDKASPKF